MDRKLERNKQTVVAFVQLRAMVPRQAHCPRLGWLLNVFME